MGALALAAALLAAERAAYVAIARWPKWFRALCERGPLARLGEPVAVVEWLFYGFKVVQALVFLAWFAAHGSLVPSTDEPGARALALAVIAAGQVLNIAVFYRLGRVGAFFGDRLGYRTPWYDGFPFSLVAHPQYVGAVLTIWGLFLLVRFPGSDWFLIPLVETLYYAGGAVLEGRPPHATEVSSRR